MREKFAQICENEAEIYRCSSSAVDLARLDLAIAENKIGDIVNLSQFLNKPV